jgi:glutamate N-acetyltransferase/amino-acid N-acetyltransferase
LEGKYKVAGFKASAWRAGLRKGEDKRNDLALFVCENEANTAGVFTKNLVKAAPVIVSQEIIKKGKARAIIVNAGYANAMTGKQGIKSARTVTEAVAKELEISPHMVIPASPGLSASIYR